MTRLDRLFSHYSADLARFAPEYKDRFGCPLCYQVFERINKLSETLAEEHIVPKRLGGTLTTLTCRQCNSHHGSTLDSHLVRRVHIESRRRPISARVRIGDGEIGAEIHIPASLDDEAIQILGIKGQSHPDKSDETMRALEKGERAIHINLNFEYVPIRSTVALVRSAYLLMFRMFGYRYILDESAKVVLHQIRNPEEETLVLKGIVWRISDRLPKTNCLAILYEPVQIQCFTAFLQLDRKTEHCAGVMLPAPGTDGSYLYNIVRSREISNRKRFTIIPMPQQGFWPLVRFWKDMTMTR
jgi:hypothetical protein